MCPKRDTFELNHECQGRSPVEKRENNEWRKREMLYFVQKRIQFGVKFAKSMIKQLQDGKMVDTT